MKPRWNLDELGLPTDAGRSKVIAPKEEVSISQSSFID